MVSLTSSQYNHSLSPCGLKAHMTVKLCTLIKIISSPIVKQWYWNCWYSWLLLFNWAFAWSLSSHMCWTRWTGIKLIIFSILYFPGNLKACFVTLGAVLKTFASIGWGKGQQHHHSTFPGLIMGLPYSWPTCWHKNVAFQSSLYHYCLKVWNSVRGTVCGCCLLFMFPDSIHLKNIICREATLYTKVLFTYVFQF